MSTKAGPAIGLRRRCRTALRPASLSALLLTPLLLNPQTGEYLPVQVTHLGTESLPLHGAGQRALSPDWPAAPLPAAVITVWRN